VRRASSCAIGEAPAIGIEHLRAVLSLSAQDEPERKIQDKRYPCADAFQVPISAALALAASALTAQTATVPNVPVGTTFRRMAPTPSPV
jgi:hypothetical protein